MKDMLDRRIYKKILVDAMNMVYIHYYGQANLSYNGRPTGMLYGIARAVTKLQKENTGAEIIFLWEGTNNRRKMMDSSYKDHLR